jgi:rhodanese-related sulfurtransferase
MPAKQVTVSCCAIKIIIRDEDNMMIKKIVLLLVWAIFMTPAAYAGEVVTFENYLKAFDYQERSNMKIGIPEMLQLYKQDKVQIIDIRFREEHQVYSFSFMKHIPINELPDSLSELDQSKLIVTVCPHYDRAELARTFLTLKGYHSKYLTDGLLGLADYLRGDRAKDFVSEMKK